MKLRKRWIIPIVALVLLLAVGLSWRWYVNRPEYRARRLLAEVRLIYDGPNAPRGIVHTLKRWLGIDKEQDDEWRAPEKIVADLVAVGPGAVPALIDGLSDEVSAVRYVSAWALGDIGPEAEEAIPVLVEALADEGRGFGTGSIVAHSACGALMDVGPKAVPALVEALGSDEEMVRRMAMDALIGIGPPAAPAIPALVELLGHEEDHVRVDAAYALTHIDPDVAAKEALPVLLAELEALSLDRDGTFFGTRGITAVWAVGKLGERARVALPALLRLTRSTNRRMRESAVEAFQTIQATETQPAGGGE